MFPDIRQRKRLVRSDKKMPDTKTCGNAFAKDKSKNRNPYGWGLLASYKNFVNQKDASNTGKLFYKL